ncbi:DUF488 domain-containing protein [Rhodanobacter sp. KK11]|jgi:uncharacterized protein (DUF488 family)|uniref:DUF488 domain-containing protein n=1 Tax=Rhodanobacter sp. KK11 TaxID=3083255 RepID=UPI0029671BBD|nr:DUF488 domain-containing protein [Rhodanobacter sp. KK11]MDW2981350.1 DUF488 domain-containing protein [Rhodanobacter sp. KK11]
MPDDPATIWTIGHSTRTLEEFLGLLGEYRIEAIADVRRFPGSRRHPHFASDALAATLPAHGIAYRWMPRLGGRRKVQPGSPNTAWRNASFQGYADYTATAEFAEGLAELLALAASQRTALMCAEAVWWRCHRSIIADVLKLRGVEVIHLIDATHTTVHPYTSPARIVDGKLSYAPAQAGLI